MKIVISHGSFGKPHENWIPWLEEELDKLNIDYLSPIFPTPDHQNFDDWKHILDMYYSFGCFDSNTIFIGHSCGAVFLAKYIIEKELKCKGYIGLAGYNNFFNNDDLMDKLNGTFYLFEESLKRLPLYAQKRVSIYSDNDPFIPQNKLKEFAEHIEAEEHLVYNGGHLNKSAGLITFEILLDYIKKLI